MGKYELLAQLTVGGMSEVFIAFTSGPGGFLKHVVLKRILPEVRSQEHFVQMFMDEARITAGLNHANIGQVFDLGEDDEGSLFLSMEFIPGQNLNQIYRAALKKGMRGLPVGLSCAVVRDVCRALHYAHTFTDASGEPAPVIHRDVAQKNIMVTYDGVTKLVDFGIAKARSSMGRTQVGTVKGTTGYMSPEQVRGEELDGRSDVFCAGVVLYELLTGHRLFSARTEYEEMVACLQSPIVPPQERVPSLVSRELNDVVMKALERDRNRRYASGRDMARAIEAAVGPNLYDAEQTGGLMKQLFANKVEATRALLDSAGEPTASVEVRRALRLMREDSNSDFPSGGLPPPAAVDEVIGDDEPTGYEVAPVPAGVARSTPRKETSPAPAARRSAPDQPRPRPESNGTARRSDAARPTGPRRGEQERPRRTDAGRRDAPETARRDGPPPDGDESTVVARPHPRSAPPPAAAPPPLPAKQPEPAFAHDESTVTPVSPPVLDHDEHTHIAGLGEEAPLPELPTIMGFTFTYRTLILVAVGGAILLALIGLLLFDTDTGSAPPAPVELAPFRGSGGR